MMRDCDKCLPMNLDDGEARGRIASQGGCMTGEIVLPPTNTSIRYINYRFHICNPSTVRISR